MFGLLAFILHFIPNLGPLIAILLPIPILVLDITVPTTNAICAMVLPTMVHLVVGNVVEPMMYGQVLRMHQVVVLFSLGFWFVLWGVVGVFLAVPLTAIIMIILKSLDTRRYPWAKDLKECLDGRIPLLNPNEDDDDDRDLDDPTLAAERAAKGPPYAEDYSEPPTGGNSGPPTADSAAAPTSSPFAADASGAAAAAAAEAGGGGGGDDTKKDA